MYRQARLRWAGQSPVVLQKNQPVSANTHPALAYTSYQALVIFIKRTLPVINHHKIITRTLVFIKGYFHLSAYIP